MFQQCSIQVYGFNMNFFNIDPVNYFKNAFTGIISSFNRTITYGLRGFFDMWIDLGFSNSSGFFEKNPLGFTKTTAVFMGLPWERSNFPLKQITRGYVFSCWGAT